jgi:hypothetical protein
VSTYDAEKKAGVTRRVSSQRFDYPTHRDHASIQRWRAPQRQPNHVELKCRIESAPGTFAERIITDGRRDL